MISPCQFWLLRSRLRRCFILAFKSWHRMCNHQQSINTVQQAAKLPMRGFLRGFSYKVRTSLCGAHWNGCLCSALNIPQLQKLWIKWGTSHDRGAHVPDQGKRFVLISTSWYVVLLLLLKQSGSYTATLIFLCAGSSSNRPQFPFKRKLEPSEGKPFGQDSEQSESLINDTSSFFEGLKYIEIIVQLDYAVEGR